MLLKNSNSTIKNYEVKGQAPYRIAVIDDSQAIVDLSQATISRRLSEMGHEVEIETFLKGKSFHTTLLDREFDLALIDYDMPTMNGLETVNKVGAIQENMKFVFVVSRTFPDLLEALEENKIFGVYIKNDLYFGNVSHLIAEQIRLKSLSQKVERWKLISRVLLAILAVLAIMFLYAYWVM